MEGGVARTVKPQVKKNRSGDLLIKAAHKFTEEKPFQPRILRSHHTAQSKLTTSKNYNPPQWHTQNSTTLTKESINESQQVSIINY